ncbi:hypothetical protein F5Y07DRAFT_97015 [Xylaria sp. FL0933]|nr:hypothetical protein F5Y07DRAFT_97015 [Xylaria sp. FL0933]
MAISLLSLSLAFFIIVTPALAAVPRPDYATVPVDAGFAPRWYMEGTPAVPAQLVSRNPQNILRDGADDGVLARDVVICDPGYHSCVEALDPGMCCANDEYCFINENWQARCCSLGVKCRDSKCGADELYCNTTSSTTVPVTTVLPSSSSSSSSGVSTTGRGEEQKHDVTTVTSLVLASTFAACCNRACSASMFLCEPTFGGQCCSYGFKCATGGNCIADPAPATATDPEVPPSCTTSQVACAESDGGGCCNTGSVCTSQTIGATISQVCAPLSDNGSSSSGGLSSGAKAGIGVGVAVGAALVIAAVTWVCIRRRRRRSGTTGTNVSAHEMRQSSGAAGDEDTGNSLLVGPPQTPWTPSSAFTDGRDALHGQRVYSDHFPDAGPYTDRDGGDGRVAPNPSLATTPPAGGSLPSDGGGRFAGSVPYHPDHILRPVEIGGAEAAQKEAAMGKESRQVDQSTAGPFELMGSPGSPSPLSPDGESHATDKGPKG